MFETQNLFKSIACPYFNGTNTTCERLYCPYRHSNQKESTQSNVTPSTSQNSVQSESPSDSKLNHELPNALENLSNALQTIQDIFKQQNDQVSNKTENLSSNIVNQLNNLSKEILSSVHPVQTESNKPTLTGSALTAHLKKQQAAAPVYNPTPINELKKQRQQELNENEKNSIKRKDETIDNTESTKKLKTEGNLNNSPSGSNLNQTQEAKKIDIVTFSKLNLSQQVLKRYEMLNMKPPTQAQINQSKLNSKKTDNTIEQIKLTEANVPQLILDTANLKVPLAIRQKSLKMIFEDCKKIYRPIELACQKASENEKSIYDRSKNKQIFLNLTAVLIKQLRDEQNQLKNATTSTSSVNSPSKSNKLAATMANTYNKVQEQKPTSHEALLNGPKANKVSYSINKTKQLEYKDLSVTQLYQMFYQYVLTEKQLEDNSFPKWLDNQNFRLAYIPNFNTLNKNSTEKQLTQTQDNFDQKLLTKTCKRCNKNFYLNSHDLSYYHGNSECVFHWGKLRNTRVNKSIEQKFSCCSGGSNSTGCEEGKHVYDGDYDGHGKGTDLKDYVETQAPSSPLELLHSKSSKNILALDCEMCYTTRGLEVTRVSAVDLNCKTVYESLVKPEAEILDYNTRWSGLTEASLKNCTKNLQQVQKELLRLVNKDTILLGHSLDSDFKALKLIHKNVIDTSVVFPHKLGAPFKRALRNLMSDYLQRIIQEDSEGHDSLEDATSCVHLMIWKINDDLRSNKKQPDFLRNQTPIIQNQMYHNQSVSMVRTSPGKITQTDSILLNQVKAKISDSQYVKQSQKSYTQMTTMVNTTKTPQSVKVNSNS
ncbi:unnamed protein product [Brachionus calyciflorus]|uniref:Exonuclease domain-containing protein n=1 Tax=Brachionus calyciflorus TaxID=104777 RepID=A0A813XXJ6_9BILA|nr:unnamed protein product [Brachionus calyciflorus]